MNAVPPQARLPGSVKSSCLPASSIVLLSLLVQPRGDAGRGEHQHRVKCVHDLLESLHQSSPLCESPLVRNANPLAAADRLRASALATFISKVQNLAPGLK